MFIWYCLCFLLLAALPPGLAPGGIAAAETRHYLQRTGERSELMSWNLETRADYRLTTRIAGQRDVTRMGTDYATRSWSVRDAGAGTDLRVARQGDRLVFSGTFAGSRIDKQVVIDAAPWYQALSMALRQFADPGITHKEFWIIRPDNLEVHRLQAQRNGEETIRINGIPTPSYKLKIQLTGFKAAFWSCHYWLRKRDRVFVRYAGPSGPPGWPLTTIDLVNVPSRARNNSRASLLNQ